MFSLKNISKIYNDEPPTYALDDVSLDLPEKGMVFIVGKSGSGKSTLLNILAGFDKPTKGTIKVFDQDLNTLTHQELDYYRNLYVGFVFQDFCLVDSLTVYHNVKMAYDFKNEKIKRSKINEILKQVSMDGYGKRYPRQLSAGQKQRIAIARALAKNPKVILADEPTGNLDSKTTKQILELLKEISKEKLVIVVSHNKDDAKNFADRIIEIGSGKIILDKVRNDITYTNNNIENNTIILPNKKRLTKEQLENINNKIKESKGNIKIDKEQDEFIDSNKITHSNKKYNKTKTSMGLRNLLKYTYLFSKSHLLSFTLMVLIVSLLIVTLSISIQFANYNGDYQFKESLEKSHTDILYVKQDNDQANEIRNSSLGQYIYQYNVEANKKFEESLNGKTYKVNNFYLPIMPVSSSNQINNSLYTYTSSQTLTSGKIRIINTLVEADLDHLNRYFADENGNLNYLGTIDENVDGIIITDFVANSILQNSATTGGFISYQDIIDSNKLYEKYGVKISAIIKTDYAQIFKDIKNNKIDKIDALDTLESVYTHAYTLNSNYYDLYINAIIEKLDAFEIYKQEYIYDNKAYLPSSTNNSISFEDNLKENEIILTYALYNDIFNTKCSVQDTSEFKPATIKLKLYNTNEKVYYEKEFIIKSLKSTNSISSIHRKDIIKDNFYQIGLIAYKTDNNISKYSIFSKYDLTLSNSYTLVVEKAIDVVKVFSDLFGLLQWILVISISVLIIVNSITTINRGLYTIGISRSMGAHVSELGFIYSFQMIMFGALVIVLSLIGDYYSTNILNYIIRNNITNIVLYNGVEEISYVVFNPLFSAICSAIVMVLTMIAIIIPIVIIKVKNPVNIIKSRK